MVAVDRVGRGERSRDSGAAAFVRLGKERRRGSLPLHRERPPSGRGQPLLVSWCYVRWRRMSAPKKKRLVTFLCGRLHPTVSVVGQVLPSLSSRRLLTLELSGVRALQTFALHRRRRTHDALLCSCAPRARQFDAYVLPYMRTYICTAVPPYFVRRYHARSTGGPLSPRRAWKGGCRRRCLLVSYDAGWRCRQTNMAEHVTPVILTAGSAAAEEG